MDDLMPTDFSGFKIRVVGKEMWAAAMVMTSENTFWLQTKHLPEFEMSQIDATNVLETPVNEDVSKP